MPSDGSEYTAGGIDLGGLWGTGRRNARISGLGNEYEPDPPPRESWESESICSTCGARLFRSTGSCVKPGAGVCPLQFRRSGR